MACYGNALLFIILWTEFCVVITYCNSVLKQDHTLALSTITSNKPFQAETRLNNI
jgi:hypothetical protein